MSTSPGELGAMSSSMADTIASMRGRKLSMFFGVKKLPMTPRTRVWSGGSCAVRNRFRSSK